MSDSPCLSPDRSSSLVVRTEPLAKANQTKTFGQRSFSLLFSKAMAFFPGLSDHRSHRPNHINPPDHHPTEPSLQRTIASLDHHLNRPSPHQTIASPDHRLNGPSPKWTIVSLDPHINGPSPPLPQRTILIGPSPTRPSPQRTIGPLEIRHNLTIAPPDHNLNEPSPPPDHHLNGQSAHRAITSTDNWPTGP